MGNLLRLITIIALVFTNGCISSNQSDPLKQKAALAFSRAQTSLLAEKKVAIDVLWVLTQIQNQRHSDAAEQFIESMKEHIKNPSYLPCVFPNHPKVTLPESPQPGIRQFLTYLDTPRGKPEKVALRNLKQFINEDADGYILTHQLIVLLLAEQAELPLSKEIIETKHYLIDKIYREQKNMKTMDCIDLYMERLALVLFFGNRKDIDQQTINAWISTALTAQLPDGSWPVSKSTISYNGEKISISSPRSHTTALAMMALQAYLNDY